MICDDTSCGQLTRDVPSLPHRGATPCICTRGHLYPEVWAILFEFYFLKKNAQISVMHKQYIFFKKSFCLFQYNDTQLYSQLLYYQRLFETDNKDFLQTSAGADSFCIHYPDYQRISALV